MINKYKMGKHFAVTITGTSLAVQRRQDQIDVEAAFDRIYVLRTSVPAGELDALGVVTAYKTLARVERDFRHIKADDLDLRPVFHRLEKRVKGHMLICMLAAYLTWYLRKASAPLAFTRRGPAAARKPRRARPPLGSRRGEGLRPAPRERPALAQLPRPARPPGHPHPQPGPPRRPPPPSRCSSSPASSALPSTSWAPRSCSP